MHPNTQKRKKENPQPKPAEVVWEAAALMGFIQSSEWEDSI